MSDTTQITGVGQIALQVTDIGQTERFYRDVLALPHLYTFGDLAFFDCGGTRLFLRAVPALSGQPVRSSTSGSPTRTRRTKGSPPRDCVSRAPHT